MTAKGTMCEEASRVKHEVHEREQEDVERDVNGDEVRELEPEVGG